MRRMITMRVEVVDPRPGEVDEMLEAFRLHIVDEHRNSVTDAHTVVEFLMYPPAEAGRP